MGELDTTNRQYAGAPVEQRRLVLPQWTMEGLRPFVRWFSKALWQTSFKGLDNIPPAGGLIIAANHQTYIDPFWVAIPIKRPLRFLAWNEAFKWPIVGRVIELLGAWPLQIEGADPTAIRRSLQWLRMGGAVMIFPEGGRGTVEGSLAKFKTGAVRMALEANVPILPVTIRGANRVWPRGWNVPRLGKVEIIYHSPLRVAVEPGEGTHCCARRETDRLAAIIKSPLVD